MAKSSKFSFRDNVIDDIQNTKAGSNQYGYLNLPKGISVYSAKPGTSGNELDFIPYIVTDEHHPDRNDQRGRAIPGEMWWKRPFYVHRNIGGDTVICLQSIGKKCPICEYRKQLMANGKADPDQIKALKNSLRTLYAVIPLNDKEYEEKIHIFDISYAMFGELLHDELIEKPEHGIFPSLDEGETVEIRFAKSTIGSSKPFAEASRIDFNKRKNQYSEALLKKVPNLDEVLNILSYKELEAKFMEINDEDLDEDDEEEQEPKSFKKTSYEVHEHTKKQKEIEEDVDDEEEEEEEEEKLSYQKLQKCNRKELVKIVKLNKLDIDYTTNEYEEDEVLIDAIAEEMGIDKPRPQKSARKKVVSVDLDEDKEQEEQKLKTKRVTNSRAHDPHIGDRVQHKKFGECLIVSLDEEDESATLKDEFGVRHIGVPFDRFDIVSFGGGKDTTSKEKEPTGDNKCPHGKKFGVDCDKFRECSTCDDWDACNDAS